MQLGAEVTDPCSKNPREQRRGHFDNIGNRASTAGTTHNGNAANYTANAFNQYTHRTVPGVFDIAGAAGSSATVYANGVSPTRHGDYFFQNFQLNNASAKLINSVLGVTPQVKSLNGVYGFHWQNQLVTTSTVTGPTGQSVQVLEFGGTASCAGMDKDTRSFPQGHYYTFQNGHTYSFSFWARTTSGSRSITPMMTDHYNDGITSTTQTIDTNWKWITVTKTYSTLGENPRLFYNWDGGGVAFQVYGAQVADITDAQYASVLPTFLTATPEAFTYDADGNLTYDGRWGYFYDAENRLIWMSTRSEAVAAGHPNQAFHILYDYLGRRVIKHPYEWNGSTWATAGAQERYVYKGWNLIARLDDMALTKSYFWGLDLSGTAQGAGGVGGLLMVQESGNSYLPMYDGNGNVMGMIKASDGSLAAAYEYDAFGQTLRESGPYAADNPFRFSTKYTDNETGLVYHDTRYYSPSLGRFLNRDTISEQGGLNLYAYVSNRVPNAWDYLGMADLVNNFANWRTSTASPYDNSRPGARPPDPKPSPMSLFNRSGGTGTVTTADFKNDDIIVTTAPDGSLNVTLNTSIPKGQVTIGPLSFPGDPNFEEAKVPNSTTTTTQSGQAVVFVVDGAGLNVFDHGGIAVRGADGRLKYYDVQAESKTNPRPGGSVNSYTLDEFKTTYGERNPRYTVVEVPDLKGVTDFLQKSSQQWKNGGYGYDAENRNCVTFICDVLARGRYNVPLIPGDRGELPWVFPNDLEQSLRYNGGKAVNGPKK